MANAIVGPHLRTTGHYAPDLHQRWALTEGGLHYDEISGDFGAYDCSATARLQLLINGSWVDYRQYDVHLTDIAPAIPYQSYTQPVQSPGQGVTLPSPTPTVALPSVNTRSNIDSELATEAPALKAAISAVEADNVDAMFGLMTWKQFPCTPGSAKGGIAPKCTELGLADGAMVPMFHYELLAYSYFTQQQMRTQLAPLLDGQSPTLALVARRPDGTGLVSFTVSDAANDGLRGVDFVVDFNSSTPLVSYTERFVSSTPLDTLRQDEYMRGLPASQILYASPALLKWEQEKTQAQSNPRPGPGVTPSP